MKKAILVMAFSLVSFYMGQAMACSGTSGDRNAQTNALTTATSNSSNAAGTKTR